jgi:hypothetical protein
VVVSVGAIAVVAIFVVLVPVFLVLRGMRALRLGRYLAATTVPPAKDGRVALQGRLGARDEPVLTPFSERAAVSYRYFIGYKPLGGDGMVSGYRVEAQGFVQTPTVLRTGFGDVAILAGLHAPGNEDHFFPADDPVIGTRVSDLLEGGRLRPAEGPSPPITADSSLLDAPNGALRLEVTTEYLRASDSHHKRVAAEGVVAEGTDAIVIGTFRTQDSAITAIDEILPADPQAALSRLRRRAIGGFLVAIGCVLFGSFMAFVLAMV